MKIESIRVGMLGTNCYILGKNDKVLVVDPGDEADKIKSIIGKRKVVGIIVTHYHFDHIGALNEIKQWSGANIYDYINLEEGMCKIDDFEFETIYTPGHKEDLISIYFKDEQALFCGDFIFENSIGRFDLEGSNFRDMKKSIRKILTYPMEMKIYPGHGDATTLAHEKNNLESWL